MHPTKRRRVDAATSVLAKPFRSPLHVNSDGKPKLPSETRGHDDQTSQEQTTSHESQLTDRPNRKASPEAAPGSTVVPTPSLNETSSSPIRPSAPCLPASRRLHALTSPVRPSISNRPVRSARLVQDPDFLRLQKHHSSISLELKHLNTALDSATQALSYISTTNDVDLCNLIARWRDISRDCAEELFATAKDRVNKMGGVAAWRDKYEKSDSRHDAMGSGGWGFADNEEIDEQDLTAEQKEQFEINRDEMMAEAEKYGLNEPEDAKEIQPEREDDSYTMDMMLKQLNVDLELIGYDKQAQRWAD